MYTDAKSYFGLISWCSPIAVKGNRFGAWLTKVTKILYYCHYYFMLRISMLCYRYAGVSRDRLGGNRTEKQR